MSHGPGSGHPETCYGCKLRSLAIGRPSDFPTRTRSKTPPRAPSNSWEKGIARDSRGMPILRADGTEMGVKEYAQKRHEIEENRRRMVQHPDPFGALTSSS